MEIEFLRPTMQPPSQGLNPSGYLFAIPLLDGGALLNSMHVLPKSKSISLPLICLENDFAPIWLFHRSVLLLCQGRERVELLLVQDAMVALMRRSCCCRTPTSPPPTP